MNIKVSPVLGTLVLQEERTLFDSELCQVSVMKWLLYRGTGGRCEGRGCVDGTPDDERGSVCPP